MAEWLCRGLQILVRRFDSDPSLQILFNGFLISVLFVEKYKVDCLIIGGGIAGVAIGRSLAPLYKNIFLIEKNSQLGQETSSRNSEVIHAGIYYPPDTLKAKLCVEGKNLLYRYLEDKNLPYKQCGNFILSTSDSETEELYKISMNANDNGVEDLNFNNPIIKQYPFLNYHQSLFSPSSGIFDSSSFINALKIEFEQKGGIILLNNICLNIDINSKAFDIHVLDRNSNEEFLIETNVILNCAGLSATEIANSVYEEEKFKIRYIKGEYYSYTGKEKLEHLIYPLPKEDSLGIHATLDLGNGIKFGPSAYDINKADYSISSKEKKNFLEAIQSYWPSVNQDFLNPDYSGIRAKIVDEEDFIVDTKISDSGIFISILNYISPGLTCSLSLAKYVETCLRDI